MTGIVAVSMLPVGTRWLAVPPTSTGVLHIGQAAARSQPAELCPGGMGGSGGWPTLCGLISLPLWRPVDTAEVERRGVCAECAPRCGL